MTPMDDKELLIRTSVLMEAVVKKVDVIEGKIDLINDQQIRSLDKRGGIVEDKVARLEKIIYGTLAIIITEGIGLAILWIRKP